MQIALKLRHSSSVSRFSSSFSTFLRESVVVVVVVDHTVDFFVCSTIL